ncbi:MAG: protein kinase [Polyangiaceae bacterium]|nr:protein kinase [Polyangiaceae bacterium]
MCTSATDNADRSAMQCLADEMVFLYLQGDLAGTSRAEVREHIDRCSACRQTVAEVAKSLDDDAPRAPDESDESDDRRMRIGRYVVAEKIGAGTSGVVYRARDPELGRDVALKVLREDTTADIAGARRRLMREAKAMARLSHPNVVAVYDAGVHEAQVFLAMELVDGPNLDDWLRATPRDLGEILDTFVDAARGLAAAHAAGLVHRDFKPANVLVGRDGRVRVTDFGLAQPALGNSSIVDVASAIGEASAGFASITRTGSFGGTPAFMAPEIFQGSAADARSDQYSYCVALYRSLYGQNPTAGTNAREIIGATMRGEIRWPLDKRVPKSVEEVLRRGLAFAHEARFGSMTDLVDALAERRAGLRERPRSKTWLVAAIGALVVASAGGAWALAASSSREAAPLAAKEAPNELGLHGVSPEVAIAAPSEAPPTVAKTEEAVASASAQPSASAAAPVKRLQGTARTIRPAGAAPIATATPAAGAASPPRKDRDALLSDPWKVK